MADHPQRSSTPTYAELVSKRFSRRTILLGAAGAAAAAAYQPSWYHGDGFGSSTFGDRIGGFAGSMADTMTSSLPPPPKSSSSGFSTGGGFSGGGGGGGGGGGW